MLKHSLSHYGTTGVSLPTSSHPLTNSSHSGDLSFHQHHLQIDPTRFIEGPTQHSHSHSKSYLDQSLYHPSLHNTRSFLDSSKLNRSEIYKDEIHHPNKSNGSIYFSPQLSQHHQQQPQLLQDTIPTTINSSSSQQILHTFRQNVLRSLSLLSILSLLLALNSLIFLLKIIWPMTMGGDDNEFKMMYEITLCLSAMCLSLNLCVLLITSAQYFFAISGSTSTTAFLQKVRVIRGVAIAGFFLSIPLFLSAIVLYTFTHLSFAIPALITTACIGLTIIIGGCAMVYHVVSWQQEKTTKNILIPQVSPNPTIELSTLV